MKLIVKTMHGLEEVLATELKQLGAQQIKTMRRGVSCEGDLKLIYQINLWSRTALRVMVPVHTFEAENEEELYREVHRFKWDEVIEVSKTFAIDHVVFSHLFKHTGYAALKTKDAIVDQIREVKGSRPSVNVEAPNILVNLHINGSTVTLSLDASGDPLNRRGYRTGIHPSPINEVLAAGMLLKAGWHAGIPLMDPMCGSGTIVLEAAMIARNMAPNLHRKRYCFQHWKNYDEALWNQLKEEAKAAMVQPRVKIVGSDIEMQAVDIAKHSSLEFGLQGEIRIQRSAFKDQMPIAKTGMVVVNPPYGERLKKEDIVNFYKEMAYYFKKNYPGWEVWIISSNLFALQVMGLKSVERNTLYNGSLECAFNKYVIE